MRKKIVAGNWKMNMTQKLRKEERPGVKSILIVKMRMTTFIMNLKKAMTKLILNIKFDMRK